MQAPSTTSPTVGFFMSNLIVLEWQNPSPLADFRTAKRGRRSGSQAYRTCPMIQGRAGRRTVNERRLYWQSVTWLDEQILISTFALVGDRLQVTLRVCTSVIWP